MAGVVGGGGRRGAGRGTRGGSGRGAVFGMGSGAGYAVAVGFGKVASGCFVVALEGLGLWCCVSGGDVVSIFGESRSPNLVSVRWKSFSASLGSWMFQRRDEACRMARVLRAQSQLSEISSRCLRPCTMSRSAFFSGRLSRWMVHAEWRI